MTIEQRKKQLAIRAGIGAATLLVVVGIGLVACRHNTSTKEDGGTKTEAGTEASLSSEEITDTVVETESETVTETESETVEIPVLDAAVLTYLEVEAGTTELVTENYFSEYSGQEFTVTTPLTTEQLAMVGSEFEVPILCDGVEGIVTVKIIDTTAPVIEGTKNRTIYQEASVSYKKNITVTDNSGESISLVVDASEVNTAVLGEYTVRFSATDSSGNTATAEITITVVDKPVIDEEYVRPMVEKIVNEVTNDNMTQWEKAWALFRWCRNNINYGSKGDRTSIWTGAYEGVYKKSGDCFAYYATYAAMLEVAGIPNMQVARVGGTSDHWWNLVNVGDGWYHCDASPRRAGDSYICFMQTDEQVAAYTLTYPEKPNYYTFEPSLYPERGTVEVYDGWKRKAL